LFGIQEPINTDIYWGITSFATVWEDMCLFYVRHNMWDDVWYADSARFSNTQIGKFKIFLEPNFQSPFYIKLAKKRRNLRPDLVRLRKFDANSWFEESFKIEPISNQSYRISLLKVDKINKNWFNALDIKLKKRFPGNKQKGENATSHKYAILSKSGLEKCIEEIKKERKNYKLINEPDQHLVVDFKFVDSSAYELEELPKKIVDDIKKQHTYELAIKLNQPGSEGRVKSQFCIPYFYSQKRKDIGDTMNQKYLNKVFLEKDIEIFQVNYDLVKDYYLQKAVQ
jgi:hypothetical protein